MLGKVAAKAPHIATTALRDILKAAKAEAPAIIAQAPGVIGLAPTRLVTPLAQKSLDTALEGIAASLTTAAGRGPGQLQSALKQAGAQLDKLTAGQGASPLVDVKLAEAFHVAGAASQGKAGQAAFDAFAKKAEAKLGDLPVAHLLQLTAARGPGITSPLSAAHLAIVDQAAKDPVQSRVLGEILTANPHPPSTVLDLLASSPTRDKSLAKLAQMFRGADAMGGLPELRNKLDADLSAGDLKAKMTGIMRERGMKGPEIETFMNVLAETRGAFAAGAPGDDMQRTNWIHTRIELLHTLEAANKLELDPMETKAALYGALFSDSFKDAGPYSVAWHNRPGAELAAPLVMSRHLDMKDPENQKLVDWSMRVAHEHQITPPLFMSGALGAVMTQHFATRDPLETAKLQPFVEEIKAKTFKPLDAPQRNGEIEFSKGAQELLRAIGIPGWAVTHEAPWARASQAAILGDVWQYASPDGLIKYGHDLRDPRHAVPMFRDPVISMDFLAKANPTAADTLKSGKVFGGAIESSLDFSLGQGASVIEDAGLRELLDTKQKEMRSTLADDVYPEVDRRLRKDLKLGPDAKIPYWNTPVSTAEKGVSVEESKVVDLVKKTFEKVMSEVGGVPLDPFQSRKAS